MRSQSVNEDHPQESMKKYYNKDNIKNRFSKRFGVALEIQLGMVSKNRERLHSEKYAP